MRPLILASTSSFRRDLLSRLRLPFEAVAPDYPETDAPGLGPGEQALRHAVGKARSVAFRFPSHLVVGCDQVAEVDGRRLGKPGTVAAAEAQLRTAAGRWVSFHTGLAVVRGEREETAVEAYRAKLRPLTPAEVRAYVAAERPLRSAGAFQIEGLGIALMEALEGRDFTALIGLPMIALTEILGRFGVSVLRPTGPEPDGGATNSGARA